MSEWKPIETAPKDGTWIFLAEKYSDLPIVGRWIQFGRHGEWLGSHEHVRTNGDAIVVDWFDQSAITHWRPLFEMPE